FDHSHIGALIAQKWNFDWEMVEAIAYHHRPEAPESGSVLAAILAVSNHLCKRMGVGLERVNEDETLGDNWGAQALGLDEAACQQTQEILKGVLEEEKKLYDQ
ncbi:MAG TPA: HDOD domain-containing protein, partial [bacterium]|nr:HDOD domain-containing protein [bacterium]